MLLKLTVMGAGCFKNIDLVLKQGARVAEPGSLPKEPF